MASVQENGTLIAKAQLQDDTQMLEVSWSDRSVDLYPYIWLRDNCQCSECLIAGTQDRSVYVFDYVKRVRPRTLEVNFSLKS